MKEETLRLADPASEPPLGTYVLPALASPRALPIAMIEPTSWGGIAPGLPRLVSQPISEGEIEGKQALAPGTSATAQPAQSNAAAHDARKPRPWIPLSALPIALAAVATSALGMLLLGPPSMMIQRSVAAKERSVAPERVGAFVPPLQSPEPIARKSGSDLSVEASDSSWVVVCADNKVLFSKLFTAGDRQTVKFNRDVIVRLGSAGSVQILKNGLLTRALGQRGEVRIVEFTPDDSHFLMDGEAGDCTHGH